MEPKFFNQGPPTLNSPVESGLCLISERLNSLTSRLSELETRLGTAMRPEVQPDPAAAMPPHPPRSELADRLYELAFRVERCTQHVADLSERLEL